MHDSRIWVNSEEKMILEEQSEFMVAADSAYPISRTVMKPYLVSILQGWVKELSLGCVNPAS